MNESGKTYGKSVPRCCELYLGVDAPAHELLNQATEWLQYSHGMIELLAELIADVGVVDTNRMVLALQGLGAMSNMGLQCAAQAHRQMVWDESQRTRPSKE